MKTILITAISICLSTEIAISQENTDLKKCVAFIFGKNAKNQYYPRGTGFFASFPTNYDSSLSYVFLVTAEHVIQKKDKSYLQEIYIRLNTRKGGSEFITIPLFNSQGRSFAVHPDSSVDIAVISFPQKIENYDALAIPSSMVANKEFIKNENIREGDDVLFCGMFVNYIGQQKNYPIFRFGKVALMTDERILFNGILSYLYLLETTTFGGNSGSPVFFKISPNRNPKEFIIGASSQYALAGIMKGFYGTQIDTAFSKVTAADTILYQNTGIAAVTPSYQLLEIFDALIKSNPKKKK